MITAQRVNIWILLLILIQAGADCSTPPLVPISSATNSTDGYVPLSKRCPSGKNILIYHITNLITQAKSPPKIPIGSYVIEYS